MFFLKKPSLVNKMAEIMAYCKDDVIDLLKLKSSAVLREVRNIALNELVAILPEYATREMRFRKKDDYMIQDIYVITYSVISRLAEKHFIKVLNLYLMWIILIHQIYHYWMMKKLRRNMTISH